MELKHYTTRGFDRGKPRWFEGMWLVAKWLFFLNPLPWPSAWRVAVLRAFGAEIGERVVVRCNVNVSFPWRLQIGSDVWLGEEVVILSLAPVVIEDHVCVSQRAFLCTGSHDFRAEHFDLVTKPITIRARSWIAAQAFIAPGVEIGAGSMVCAGSILSRSVPAGSLVQGNPAIVVKQLE